MYALVNAMFGFQLGKMKKNGKFKTRPHFYKDPIDMYHTYSRLNALQKLVIMPAIVNADGTYTQVEFASEEE